MDANGAQIPAATIIEKGTKNGTVASADGTFSIMVKSSKAVLVISALGFETVEMPASADPLSVKLGVDTKTLTEVVAHMVRWRCHQ